MTRGALLEVIDFTGVNRQTFTDWFVDAHGRSIEASPGVLTASYWIGRDDPNVALAFFDLETAAVAGTVPADAAEFDAMVVGHAGRRIDRYIAEQRTPGGTLSPPGAAVFYMPAMNIEPAAEDEFNEWYDNEHMARLSAVPGVLSARRFVASTGPHRYLAVYHLDDPAVRGGPAWLEAAETPWTHRNRRSMRDKVIRMFLPCPVPRSSSPG